ncbi:MAG: EamA family transporter, partial [Firmicutes bacterium]|nr:EamA family transporter [Bacillota bacterium]
SEQLMSRVNVVTYNFNAVVVVAAVGWLICLLGGAGDFALPQVTVTGWLAMAAVGVMVSGAATFLTMKFIPQVGAVATSLLMLLEPPMAAALGWIVFGDKLGGWQLAGGGLILASVLLPVLFREKRTAVNV